MRVIIVHTLEQACAAMASAAELNRPVILQSAPDALFYAGSLYLLHMFTQAKKSFPGIDARFILDCADAGSEAIAAMRSGHRWLRSSAAPEVQEKLVNIAKSCGAEIIQGDYEALDLLQVRDTTSACREWLK